MAREEQGFTQKYNNVTDNMTEIKINTKKVIMLVNEQECNI